MTRLGLFLCLASSTTKRTFATISTMERKIIAVCQLTATNDKDKNFETCKSLIETAKESRAQMVFLPEACDFIGESKDETFALSEPFPGPLMQKYCQLAKNNNVWLSLGGLHEKVSPTKVRNSHVVIDSSGNMAAIYRKTHLFDVEIPDKGVRLKESDYVERGKEIIAPVETPIGRVGLAICYDMRFPELSLVLARHGAQILTYPSAFTFETGSAHWETLLRARAIESQCYVVAAAQTGRHNKKRTSWGHAMVVDPWGVVIAQCYEGTNMALAEIDLKYVDKVRTSMPVWQHRRLDLYPELVPLKNEGDIANENTVYQFGQTSVSADAVFYRTPYTIAFTNKKCVLPGHVLVAPIRPAKRIQDLTKHEISDLFSAVQKVQKSVENEYKANSSTITVQDGVDAGQHVFHVHVHVIPRRPGDFKENDEIYRELEKHDKEETGWRSESEMANEAAALRRHFSPS
ncbi:nitrilase and fragile histidine triad fusion protein NitFhit [Schistocerca nitens]|uniref:nitrilase and fragile histidine triad fusion protein NitFhit n=1 Tax=Schistocerca nitens TaxID=7011 RepID=UPI002118F071|nr:nitrilase and fragile histidine triad fusion protein NitFhit [Schistocerca nitens]